MKGKSHIILATGIGVTTAMIIAPTDINHSIELVSFSILGGLFPDIDLPQSTLGKVTKPISTILNRLFHHRGFIHSPLFAMIICFLLYKYLNFYFFIGFTVGIASHIISDTMTKGGIPWLYPFKKKKYHLTNIESGRGFELPIVMFLAGFLPAVIFCYKAGVFNL